MMLRYQGIISLVSARSWVVEGHSTHRWIYQWGEGTHVLIQEIASSNEGEEQARDVNATDHLGQEGPVVSE